MALATNGMATNGMATNGLSTSGLIVNAMSDSAFVTWFNQDTALANDGHALRRGLWRLGWQQPHLDEPHHGHPVHLDGRPSA